MNLRGTSYSLTLLIYGSAFQNNFLRKIPSFGVFTQALGKYPGIYPKNIYLPTGYLPSP
ncbi:unnamed protein product, partial [Larinioides sclopetarius]